MARRRVQAEDERSVEAAWLNAKLTRAKKILPLDRLLWRRQKKRQTVGQQRSALHMLATIHGGTVSRGAKKG